MVPALALLQEEAEMETENQHQGCPPYLHLHHGQLTALAVQLERQCEQLRCAHPLQQLLHWQFRSTNTSVRSGLPPVPHLQHKAHAV